MTSRCAIPALALLLLPGIAAGQDQSAATDEDGTPSSEGNADTLKSAEKAYEELNYDKALALLAELETKTNLKTWEKVAILKYRAFIHINSENEIFARDAIVSIYNLDPKFSLPESEPPKILKVFADVKKEFKPKKKKKKEVPTPEAKRIITAGVSPEVPTQVKKEGPPAAEANLFVRFWPAWAGLAAGVALFTPGAVIGATAADDRAKIENAPRDSSGRIIGITAQDARKMQDDANTKALTGNILMGAGAAVAVGGALLFFLYDDGWHGWRAPVFATSDGRSLAVNIGGSW